MVIIRNKTKMKRAYTIHKKTTLKIMLITDEYQLDCQWESEEMDSCFIFIWDILAVHIMHTKLHLEASGHIDSSVSDQWVRIK